MSKHIKCPSTAVFESDLGGYGRTTIFYCERPRGHEGKHKESVKNNSIKCGHPYTITWEASIVRTHTTRTSKKKGD